MIEQLIEWDKALFIWLNGMHTPWLDPVMMFITQTLAWLPLYIFLLYLIVKDFGWKSWPILLGIAVTILLADQLTSGFMKPYFGRYRPSVEPSLQGLVHIVNGYTGGKYGFSSGHAANTFGTATFIYLLFRPTKPWIRWMFLWAAIMTYTRIYLGVHYPTDILVGALVGMGCGFIGYRISLWLIRWNDRRLTEIT